MAEEGKRHPWLRACHTPGIVQSAPAHLILAAPTSALPAELRQPLSQLQKQARELPRGRLAQAAGRADSAPTHAPGWAGLTPGELTKAQEGQGALPSQGPGAPGRELSPLLWRPEQPNWGDRQMGRTVQETCTTWNRTSWPGLSRRLAELVRRTADSRSRPLWGQPALPEGPRLHVPAVFC